VATDHLAVAAIAGPHGVRGQFKVKLFAESPDALVNYGSLHIDDGRALKLAIKSVNAKGLVVVSADGINSREAAEKLRGMLLSTLRVNLPDPADDELYHADILGAAAVHVDGTTLGIVVALYNFGAGEIVEVKPVSGPSLMLPFEGESVVSVDVANGRVVLAPPAGFLDDETSDENSDETGGENKSNQKDG
jgi:16S rRNA processing protein RimM